MKAVGADEYRGGSGSGGGQWRQGAHTDTGEKSGSSCTTLAARRSRTAAATARGQKRQWNTGGSNGIGCGARNGGNNGIGAVEIGNGGGRGGSDGGRGGGGSGSKKRKSDSAAPKPACVYSSHVEYRTEEGDESVESVAAKFGVPVFEVRSMSV